MSPPISTCSQSPLGVSSADLDWNYLTPREVGPLELATLVFRDHPPLMTAIRLELKTERHVVSSASFLVDRHAEMAGVARRKRNDMWCYRSFSSVATAGYPDLPGPATSAGRPFL